MKTGLTIIWALLLTVFSAYLMATGNTWQGIFLGTIVLVLLIHLLFFRESP